MHSTRSILWIAVTILVALPITSKGQTSSSTRFLSLPVGFESVVVDFATLYVQSKFGIRVSEELRDAKLALGRENEQFTEMFENEELELVKRRNESSSSEFSIVAKNFDEKVVNRRKIQDEKGVSLVEWEKNQQDLFRQVVGLSLVRLAIQYGILTILPSSSLIWYDQSLDFTQIALVQVNMVLDDGTQLQEYISALDYAGINQDEN